MKPEVKRRVRQYGIPLDLAILATGVGLLLPSIPTSTLLFIFLAAVALSALKLGWRSGLAAVAAGFLALAGAFSAELTAGHYVTFLALGLLITGVSRVLRPDRPRAETEPRDVVEVPPLVEAVEPHVDRAPEMPVALEAVAKQLENDRLQAERKLEKDRLESERVAKERSKQERAEQKRVSREKKALEQKLEQERLALERAAREKEELQRKLEEERVAAERAASERIERERLELAKRLEEERAEIERVAAERAEKERLDRERAEQEREKLARELASLAEERDAREKLEREKNDLAAQLQRARDEAENAIAERIAAERVELQKQFDEKMRAEREAIGEKLKTPAAGTTKPEPEKPGILSTLTGWLKTPQQSKPAVNLTTKKIASNKSTPAPPSRKKSIIPAPPPVRQGAGMQTQARERRPRVLMLERRRAMADTATAKMRELGLDVQVVERWIDAVDELFRFRPDAIFIDVDLPDFQKVHRSVSDQAPKLPIVLSAASHAALPPGIPRAGSVIRPYHADAIAKIARDAVSNPQMLLERQAKPAVAPPAPPARTLTPVAAAEPLIDGPAPLVATPPPEASERYDVVCFNCRVAFGATDADWCSCLTKERTLVCTNCLTCFCKAPPAYKEKFWVEAPPRLFERKSAELKKEQIAVGANVPLDDVKRPLVLLVEDDEDIQTIVQRVCSNLGYGFVSASNGQDGLTVARLYKPNLILSDAFMPKLDGREMCRILKEEAIIPDARMIVMTGLYTDTKYKSEALKRFHIDDYLSKPVSITDLINLLQRHLEGVASAAPQEDLFEQHRQQLEAEQADEPQSDDDFTGERSIALADLLDQTPAAGDRHVTAAKSPTSTNYEICCHSCSEMFDATRAEWCTCLGRDQTLVCPHCNNCFCKAPAAYKERFWIDAPPTLFERKMIGSKRNVSGKNNPSPMEVKRPLILLVEDDENIQLIVKTVVTTMGYGFIVAANGQEGLAMAREYNPDLILSDAFMPKLDGREMCRLLKEDPATSRMKAIIMTGLYTDRKYRNEALSYFKVDDYVAKPVAVDDLIKLMKKHLPQDVQPTM